jgi:hypothetical protein
MEYHFSRFDGNKKSYLSNTKAILKNRIGKKGSNNPELAYDSINDIFDQYKLQSSSIAAASTGEEIKWTGPRLAWLAALRACQKRVHRHPINQRRNILSKVR